MILGPRPEAPLKGELGELGGGIANVGAGGQVKPTTGQQPSWRCWWVLVCPPGDSLCQHSDIYIVGKLFQNKSSYAHLALFFTTRGNPRKGTFALAQGHSTRGKGEAEAETSS